MCSDVPSCMDAILWFVASRCGFSGERVEWLRGRLARLLEATRVYAELHSLVSIGAEWLMVLRRVVDAARVFAGMAGDRVEVEFTGLRYETLLRVLEAIGAVDTLEFIRSSVEFEELHSTLLRLTVNPDGSYKCEAYVEASLVEVADSKPGTGLLVSSTEGNIVATIYTGGCGNLEGVLDILSMDRPGVELNLESSEGGNALTLYIAVDPEGRDVTLDFSAGGYGVFCSDARCEITPVLAADCPAAPTADANVLTSQHVELVLCTEEATGDQEGEGCTEVFCRLY